MMTNELTKIRCGDCGNADPGRFHRIYVEASRERIVDGDWVVVEAWEHDDGEGTYPVCEKCGSTDVEETYGEVEVRSPSSLASATEIVAEAIAEDGRLSLLEDDPERGLVAVSLAPLEDPGGLCDVFRVGVKNDFADREVSG